MKLDFQPLTAKDVVAVNHYFWMRPNPTCDSTFVDSFIWRTYYNIQFAVVDEKALLFLMYWDNEYSAAMPLCAPGDVEHYFYVLVDYFREELHQKFKIALADEPALELVALDKTRFSVTEQPDARDYLYSGEALRTLAGKKLHKKKNHVNAFLREYEGRYEYRSLNCDDRQEIWGFLDKWRQKKGEGAEEHLDYEVSGIHELLRAHDCELMKIRMGGVYIDGKLEAFSVASFNPAENMAVIHIEKANPDINGLYQFINQQFLVHEYPTVALVNREDDLGLEGLRQAKLSYQPVDFARKFLIREL
ncbi:MAG: phosphatidylglycerol lysyltransferase domain-containing protein [Lachnospiraceae bacterium]|jgi:hypothetical protein|nr:phosphatidylglycerol lysyltransferase domain-containing protein [Lachnospiraceae bacterium]